MKKKKILAAVLLLALGAFACLLWLRGNYFRMGMDFYRKDSTFLDLTGKKLSEEDYQTLLRQFPDSSILWDVPVQSGSYPSDARVLELKTPTEQDLSALAYFPALEEIRVSALTDPSLPGKIRGLCPDARLTCSIVIGDAEYPADTRKLTLSSLSEEEAALLDCLPLLEEVDAGDCTDYPALMALLARKPELEIRYCLPVAGVICGRETEELHLKNPDVAELQEKFAWLPGLRTVMLEEPAGTAEALRLLRETYPGVQIHWTKTLPGGIPCSSLAAETDLSGISLTLSEVEEIMAYCPGAEKVILTDCGVSDEEMAAFREEKREDYKVVWTVDIAGIPTRTDDTIFHACGSLVYMSNEQSKSLAYCEDMVIVDIGHSFVEEVEWVRNMPNLKYLILADNRIRDLSPVASCKNLIYLELHINYYLRDLTPLLECRALEDLNVSQCPEADLTPLKEMTWLKNLWLCNNELLPGQEQQLRSGLPDTVVKTGSFSNTASGWRSLQNYFDMREMMGQPANPW